MARTPARRRLVRGPRKLLVAGRIELIRSSFDDAGWFASDDTGVRIYVSGPAGAMRAPACRVSSNAVNGGKLATIEIVPDERILSSDDARLALP